MLNETHGALLVTHKASEVGVPRGLQLTAPVGSGGYGAVFVAPTVDPRVIKLSKSGLDHDALMEMLVAEHLVQYDLSVSPTTFGVLIERDEHGWCAVVMERGRCLSYIPTRYVGDECIRSLLRTFVQWRTSGLVHGDIKPANLVTVNGLVKAIDWGRGLLPQHAGVPLPPNAGLYAMAFRAPEMFFWRITLADLDKLEVFAAGLTVLDLLVPHDTRTKWPFLYASTPLMQLNRVMALMGTPPAPHCFSGFPAFKLIDAVPATRLTDHKAVADSGASASVLDVLTRMLQPVPGSRISSEELATHPFVVGEDHWAPTVPKTETDSGTVPAVLSPPIDVWTAVTRAVLKQCDTVQQWHACGLTLDVLRAWLTLQTHYECVSNAENMQRLVHAALILASKALGYCVFFSYDSDVNTLERLLVTTPGMPSLTFLLQSCVPLNAATALKISDPKNGDVCHRTLSVLYAIAGTATPCPVMHDPLALQLDLLTLYMDVAKAAAPVWVTSSPLSSLFTREAVGTWPPMASVVQLPTGASGFYADAYPDEVELAIVRKTGGRKRQHVAT